MIIASDLEGTLTSGRTWRGLGRYLNQNDQRWAYRRFFLSRMPAYLLAKAGLGDEQSFREEWIADLLGLLQGHSVEAFHAIAEWVVEQELWPKRHVALLQELETHRKAGSRIVIVSATYQPVLEAFAQRIGAEALGTQLGIANNQLTGAVDGPVNSSTSKVAQLQATLGDEPLSLAFGDTMADIPMLSLSEEAAVVDPDPELQQVAQQRGWRIVTTQAK